MPNFLYDTARQSFLTQITLDGSPVQTDWVNDTFYAILVDNTYNQSQASHVDMTSVVGSSIVAGPVVVNTSASQNNGIAESTGDTTFTTVTGNTAVGVVIFRGGATTTTLPYTPAADELLIAYIDDDATTNLPVNPNGGDITIVWDGGSGNIFKL